MTAKIGAVEDEEHCIRLGCILHLAFQHVMRYTLVFRAWIEAVDAGQIDENDVAIAGGSGATDALLDGDAREVRDFLAQSSEAIEQGRFSRVRRPDDGHHMRARCLGQLRWRRCDSTTSATVAIAHGFRD